MNIPYLTFILTEKILGRNTLKRFREFKIVQWYSAQKLKEFQFRRLKKLLIHAYDHTDYYRQSFDKVGFNPKSMNSFEDFQKAPFLTKTNIKNNPDKFVSKDKKRRLVRYATSGSTGHPLVFYLSNERIAANKAVYLLLYSWWGLEIGDREVVLWGSQKDFRFYNIMKRIRDNLLHTHLLPTFQMSEPTMLGYIDFIKQYRPKDLFGYAHSIYLLAKFAQNRNMKLNNVGIKVVFTTAELLYDYQRETIREIFGCPVCNCYGGRESGLIAFECPRGNMHLNPNIYTEFINGKIVVTDLDSFGFPFIRYETGDEGVLSNDTKCKCGVNSPLVKHISGRHNDYIINTKGEFIHPLALEYIFREMEEIDYFKIIQKEKDKLLVNLVVKEKLRKCQEDYIRKRINEAMSFQTQVILKYKTLSEIPAEDKHKFVSSEIIKNYI